MKWFDAFYACMIQSGIWVALFKCNNKESKQSRLSHPAAVTDKSYCLVI